MKKFNKFLAGEIGFDGKSIILDEVKPAKAEKMKVCDDLRFEIL